MNERYEPVDPRHEDALSRALHAEAETIRPAGDGLIRIRARVDRRRVHNRWILPTATAATVAATVTAVVASGVFAGPSHSNTATSTFASASLTATDTKQATP